jgi:hypothetical protein
MIPDDRRKFIEVVLGFAELKGKKLSTPALELYWRAMQDWCIEDFQSAAAVLLKTAKYMPTPSDFEALRKAAVRMTAGEAWLTVLELTRTAQYRSGHGSGDELIDRCAHMLGGYAAIAMTDVDKLHFLERRFCEHFEAKQGADDARQALGFQSQPPGVLASWQQRHPSQLVPFDKNPR